MRKYYIFCINNNIYELYKNNPGELFVYFKNIKNNRINIQVYKQICKEYNKEIYKNYFKTNKIDFKNTYIKIISKTNYPIFLEKISKTNQKFLVCDFNNNDYFWLNKLYCNL